MTTELYSNLAKTTLNGAITSSATTLTPTSTTGFPTPGGGSQFRITIDSEIMIVTGVTTGVWTVTRGAESTTAAAHANLAPIYQTFTAASIAAVPIASGDLSGTTTTATVSQITGSGGFVSILCNETWGASTATPTLSQATPLSDATVYSMHIAPQAPYASATSNKTPGSLFVDLVSPLSGGTEPAFNITHAGTTFFQFQGTVGTPSRPALYMTTGLTPSASNWNIQTDTANLAINASLGGVVITSAGLEMISFNSNATYGGYIGIEFYYPNVAWNKTVTTPTITQIAQAVAASPVAGYPMTVIGQSGQGATGSNVAGATGAAVTISGGTGGISTGSAANSAGGAVNINGGVAGTGGTGATGAAGSVNLQVGGTTIKGVSASGPATTIHSLTVATTGTTTLAATDYLYEYQYVATVTLAGNITIQFPNAVGHKWILDTSLVTFGSDSITIQCGTGSASTTLTSSSKLLWTVACPAANTCTIG